jgi:hypothetical protein
MRLSDDNLMTTRSTAFGGTILALALINKSGMRASPTLLASPVAAADVTDAN